MWFESAYAFTEIYHRSRLLSGDVVAGPAVIEEFGSTIPVHPGFVATVDRHGNVLLTKDEIAPRGRGHAGVRPASPGAAGAKSRERPG